MMIDGEMLEMVRTALVFTLKISFPVLMVGILVGLFVSIVQSVTQVQEQTLSMVPKIFAMTIVVIILLPWIAAKLADFAVSCFRLVSPI